MVHGYAAHRPHNPRLRDCLAGCAACCNETADSPYADRYALSVAASDLSSIRRHADLLVFGDGRGFGPLTALLVFIPAFLNLDTAEKLDRYCHGLKAAIGLGEPERFCSLYDTALAELGDWIEDCLDGPSSCLRLRPKRWN